MKNFLPVIVCLLSVTAGYAQIKGDPQLKEKPQSLRVTKVPSKLSPDLKSLDQNGNFTSQIKGVSKPLPSFSMLPNLMQRKGDKVLVDFTISNNDVNAAKAELEKVGVNITASYGRVISGYIPINSLPKIESAASIKYAKPSYKPMHVPVKPTASLNKKFITQICGNNSVTGIVTQGDTAQLSYKARKNFGVSGAGVKVGVLSDSYNNLGSADVGVQKGELPGATNPYGFTNPVNVIKDLEGAGNDEGRAMLEIIHDVAPSSDLAFYTAYDGQADFAQGIQTLADAGCKVITDDIYYFAEPFFQDGIIAQSVDEVKKRGVTYFSAAGNQSVRSYESDYRPSTVEPFGPGTGTAHNFSAPGDAPRYAQPLYIPVGGTFIMSFQWDQSFYSASGVGATSDFDAYLTDLNGNVVAVGGSDNLQSGDPVEVFGYTNTTTSPTFFLTIVKYAGPDVSRLKYVLFGSTAFYLTNPPIPGILAPTLVGHAKAAGAIATGAAFYLNTPAYGLDTALVEYFSSKDGVATYFDAKGNRIAPVIRQKPEIVAPDGGNTSFFDPFGNGDISEDADTLPNFFGTSAAAPHAAGVAALMIESQKQNTITPDQIKGILSSTASDMDDIYTDGFDVGFDYNTGYGFINADKAVGEVHFPNVYVKNLHLKPLCSDAPSVTRNWKISNPNLFPVTVQWRVIGSDETGTIAAPPGDTSFTTKAVSYHGQQIPNLAILIWKNNLGATQRDIAFSTKAKCGVDKVSDENSDRPIASVGALDKQGKPMVNVADVYPNPSSKSFRLYLSLSGNQPTTIELMSLDGKKLQTKTVNQSTGTVDIDAAAYKPGIYLLHVRQGSFFKTIRLIKE